MAEILHKTKGIVVRTVKYGDTSIIVSIFTALFGLQSYVVSGARKISKKGDSKGNFFQPAAILDLVLYHNELRQLNRIKEVQWAHIYHTVYTDVLKNGVAQYMVELLGKCLKQPESNSELFDFTEDCFLSLDACNDTVMANFPIFFSVHLCHFFGFAPQVSDTRVLEDEALCFDLSEGVFSTSLPLYGMYLDGAEAVALAQVLQTQQPQELRDIKISALAKRKILDGMETYYALQIQDFGRLRTLPVLREIMR